MNQRIALHTHQRQRGRGDDIHVQMVTCRRVTLTPPAELDLGFLGKTNEELQCLLPQANSGTFPLRLPTCSVLVSAPPSPSLHTCVRTSLHLRSSNATPPSTSPCIRPDGERTVPFTHNGWLWLGGWTCLDMNQGSEAPESDVPSPRRRLPKMGKMEKWGEMGGTGGKWGGMGENGGEWGEMGGNGGEWGGMGGNGGKMAVGGFIIRPG